MTKSDQDGPRSGHRLKHVITVLLLLAVIVTGVAAFHSRQQWWDKYMSYMHPTR